MSLQRTREQQLSCSEGALNLRQEPVSNLLSRQENWKIGDEACTFKGSLKGRRNAVTNIPDMMSKVLKHSNSYHQKRRKENLFSRMLSGGGGRKGNVLQRDNAALLRSAVRKYETERVIEILSKPDTDINEANENGITSLHEAAIDGNFICMKVLVIHGADIDKLDCEGFSSLDYAVFGGNYECAAYLIEKGAVVDRIRDGQIMNKDKLAANRQTSV